MKKIMALGFAILVLISLSAFANAIVKASIGNARMIIYTNVTEGTTTVVDKYIKVINSNEVPVQINLVIGGDLVGITQLEETSFVLEPQETKNAKFKVYLKYGGRYEGSIGVGFTSMNASEKGGAGLSSKIIIIAEGPQNPNLNTTTSYNETIEDNETVKILPRNVTKQPRNETNNQPLLKEPKKPVLGIIIMLSIVIIGLAVYILMNTILGRPKK